MALPHRNSRTQNVLKIRKELFLNQQQQPLKIDSNWGMVKDTENHHFSKRCLCEFQWYNNPLEHRRKKYAHVKKKCAHVLRAQTRVSENCFTVEHPRHII